MELKPIRTENEYLQALQEAEKIFDAQKGTPDGDRLELLAILIEDYEDREFPLPKLDPIESIKYVMEERDFNQNEVAHIFGDKAKASLVLNRKRKLSLTMIRKAHEALQIPLDILIQDYSTAGPN
ncbi:helix-turn-helix domain-containing protein [Fulvivirga ligni]|uniref:helix-turn-helix domain-containing protein n=1 Tax=Fulvivirga ligni TaxID=2904246 RepID=UPI001F28252E|nr:transcriptional regulator [Fulvivirga ligni]UII21577.1 transcriptional regulator [Fulvivirga ligni]UII21631.1 transcriptional regulator [Fulvivirga ligni]